MPAVDNIQSGTVNLTVSDGLTGNITISSTNTARTFLQYAPWNDHGGGLRLSRHMFTLVLANATTITWSRQSLSHANPTHFYWAAIEVADADIDNIQVGTLDCITNPDNVTVTATALENTIITDYYNTDSLGFNGQQPAIFYLPNTTTLEWDFESAPTTGKHYASYQLIEFSAASTAVQTGRVFIPNIDPTTNVATITSVDTSKTVIYPAGFSTGQVNPHKIPTTSELSNSTAVTLTHGAGTTIVDEWIGYQVCEHLDTDVVAYGTGTISDGSNTDQPTFTAMDINVAAVVGRSTSFTNGHQLPTYATIGHGDIQIGAALDTSDPVTFVDINRGLSNSNVKYTYFVQEFNGAASPISITVGKDDAALSGQVATVVIPSQVRQTGFRFRNDGTIDPP